MTDSKKKTAPGYKAPFHFQGPGLFATDDSKEAAARVLKVFEKLPNVIPELLIEKLEYIARTYFALKKYYADFIAHDQNSLAKEFIKKSNILSNFIKNLGPEQLARLRSWVDSNPNSDDRISKVLYHIDFINSKFEKEIRNKKYKIEKSQYNFACKALKIQYEEIVCRSLPCSYERHGGIFKNKDVKFIHDALLAIDPAIQPRNVCSGLRMAEKSASAKSRTNIEH